MAELAVRHTTPVFCAVPLRTKTVQIVFACNRRVRALTKQITYTHIIRLSIPLLFITQGGTCSITFSLVFCPLSRHECARFPFLRRSSLGLTLRIRVCTLSMVTGSRKNKVVFTLCDIMNSCLCLRSSQHHSRVSPKGASIMFTVGWPAASISGGVLGIRIHTFLLQKQTCITKMLSSVDHQKKHAVLSSQHLHSFFFQFFFVSADNQAQRFHRCRGLSTEEMKRAAYMDAKVSAMFARKKCNFSNSLYLS